VGALRKEHLAMMEIRIVLTWLQYHRRMVLRTADEDNERGAGIVEYAIMTAVLCAAVLLIVGILVSKAKGAAEGVKTQ
jgi:Flp pilus assembly pilin Flp